MLPKDVREMHQKLMRVQRWADLLVPDPHCQEYECNGECGCHQSTDWISAYQTAQGVVRGLLEQPGTRA